MLFCAMNHMQEKVISPV